jgi:hypothetical protein
MGLTFRTTSNSQRVASFQRRSKRRTAAALLQLWTERRRSRNELRRSFYDEAALETLAHDMASTPDALEREAAKPFWQP